MTDRPMKTHARRRRAPRRGAAMVEAVILLPVLAVILFGILFVQEHASATQSARGKARRCAWQHAVGGCGEIPEGCGDTDHQETQRTTPPADAMDAASAQDPDAAVEAVAAETSMLVDVPLIGDAIDGLFGTATSFTVSRDVERAGLAGNASGRVYLLCNARPTTPWNVVRQTFCENTGLCEAK